MTEKIMYSFGCKNEIQIQYEFLAESDGEQNTLEDTWGKFRFYISNRDLCEYHVNETRYTYEDRLFWVAEWLCKNLIHIIGYDPFPIPVAGNSAIELLENTHALKLELIEKNESEMHLVDRARFEWESRHGWFTSRGGSILPMLLFRRIDDQIEASWDSAFWMKQGIRHSCLAGSHFIQRDIFKKVVLDFLYAFLNEWNRKSSKHGRTIAVLPEFYQYLSIFDADDEHVD